MVADDDDMAAAARLLSACLWDLNLETALDEVDTRAAAAGLAGILAGLVRLSGLPPRIFLTAIRDMLLAERMRAATSGAVTKLGL